MDQLIRLNISTKLEYESMKIWEIFLKIDFVTTEIPFWSY